MIISNVLDQTPLYRQGVQAPKAKDACFYGKGLFSLLIVFNTNAVLLKLSSLGAIFFIAALNLFSAGTFLRLISTRIWG